MSKTFSYISWTEATALAYTVASLSRLLHCEERKTEWTIIIAKLIIQWGSVAHLLRLQQQQREIERKKTCSKRKADALARKAGLCTCGLSAGPRRLSLQSLLQLLESTISREFGSLEFLDLGIGMNSSSYFFLIWDRAIEGWIHSQVTIHVYSWSVMNLKYKKLDLIKITNIVKYKMATNSLDIISNFFLETKTFVISYI